LSAHEAGRGGRREGTTVAAGEAKLDKITETYAEFKGETKLGDLTLQTQTRAEFDGYVRNRMTLTPKKPVKLSRLSLVVAMPAKEGELFCATAGGFSASIGTTPKRWSSREVASGTRVGSFVPYVFLTDSERGFCWFADNDKGWVIDPNGDPWRWTTTARR